MQRSFLCLSSGDEASDRQLSVAQWLVLARPVAIHMKSPRQSCRIPRESVGVSTGPLKIPVHDRKQDQLICN